MTSTIDSARTRSQRFALDKAVERKARICLFCLSLLFTCYFYQGDNANQTARVLPAFAFVERGTFRIDDYLDKPWSTPDWVEHGGHRYSNKAPGSILLATALYSIIYTAERISGYYPVEMNARRLNIYLINVVASGILISLSIPVFYRLLRSLRISAIRSFVLCLTLMAGTLLFPYATGLWGHTTAAALLIFSLYFARVRRSTLCGTFGAFAVLVDYLALFSFLLTGLWMWRAGNAHAKAFCLGAIPIVLLHAGYTWMAFGTIGLLPQTLHSPMTHPNLFLGHFVLPSAVPLSGLTVGEHSGMFRYMPLLLLVPAGFAFWLRRDKRDPLLYFSLLSVGFVFLANLSFSGWDGGWSAGPRYQISMLPLWILSLKELPRNRFWSTTWWILGLISIGNMVKLAHKSPYLPSIPAPDLRTITDGAPGDLGMLLGLGESWSLVPFFIGAAVLLYLAWNQVGPKAGGLSQNLKQTPLVEDDSIKSKPPQWSMMESRDSPG